MDKNLAVLENIAGKARCVEVTRGEENKSSPQHRLSIALTRSKLNATELKMESIRSSSNKWTKII